MYVVGFFVYPGLERKRIFLTDDQDGPRSFRLVLRIIEAFDAGAAVAVLARPETLAVEL